MFEFRRIFLYLEIENILEILLLVIYEILDYKSIINNNLLKLSRLKVKLLLKLLIKIKFFVISFLKSSKLIF